MSDPAFLPGDTVPIFGAPDGVRRYIPRASAYAVIRNDAGKLAVVRSRFGSLLPGGGIESGESPEDAVRREVMEEAGFVVANLSRLGCAIEFIESIEERQCFEKRCHFFTAGIERADCATEAEVRTVWLDPADAIETFHHQSHVWAVGVAITAAAAHNRSPG